VETGVSRSSLMMQIVWEKSGLIFKTFDIGYQSCWETGMARPLRVEFEDAIYHLAHGKKDRSQHGTFARQNGV
jgi:hypothetical protein